ncbi:hypothetical protein LP419_33460 [Massilia sp. H-1]|nr:hypothetical protein LP419_33460 [Massilia sp. H-1]
MACAAPLTQPERLKTLGFFYFTGYGLLFGALWAMCFLFIFNAPGWVKYDAVYAFLAHLSTFAFINFLVHLLFLKLKCAFKRPD